MTWEKESRKQEVRNIMCEGALCPLIVHILPVEVGGAGRGVGEGVFAKCISSLASPLKILPWFSLAVRVNPGSQ